MTLQGDYDNREAPDYYPCPTCGRYPGQDAGECPFEGGPDCLEVADRMAEEAAEAAAWERDLDPSDRADFDQAVEDYFERRKG